MTENRPTQPTTDRGNARLIAILLAIGLPLAVLLSVEPGLDRWATGLFYDSERGFVASYTEPWITLRKLLKVAGVGLALVLLASVAHRVLRRSYLWVLDWRAIAYIIAVIALGPGLIVNGVLKEHWGRARPSHTVDFGGAKTYSPPLVIADQCDGNCSFVSGDAAWGFAFVTFGFLGRTRRQRLVGFAGGLAFGTTMGLLRIAQGGHYLSDIFYSGLITVGLAWLLYDLLIRRGWLDRWAAPKGDSERTGPRPAA
ncbi:MAG: phosphatase PAP2 family protein [Rhodospirillaceae bacterium]|jgi:lipid A 4'-phosphatase|nr:phosphatase PAP2 family protein [Rhodospirillaceae bacterium]